jgi:hypothetical protein
LASLLASLPLASHLSLSFSLFSSLPLPTCGLLPSRRHNAAKSRASRGLLVFEGSTSVGAGGPQVVHRRMEASSAQSPAHEGQISTRKTAGRLHVRGGMELHFPPLGPPAAMMGWRYCWRCSYSLRGWAAWRWTAAMVRTARLPPHQQPLMIRLRDNETCGVPWVPATLCRWSSSPSSRCST